MGSERFKEKMRTFMAEVDDSGDDVIQRKEFVAGLNGTRMKTWLSSMGVEVADSDLLFDLIGGGDNELTLTHLVNGLARLKGQARNIDLIGLTFKISRLWDVLMELKQT